VTFFFADTLNSEDLKTAIREKIDLKVLNGMDADFRERLQTCIRENGHHLSDIVFRT